MVYSEFLIQTAPRFGDYAACNPNASTGVFQCEHYSTPSKKVPKQCKGNFWLYDSDCLNGTVYKTIEDADKGECCAACSADGAKCEGWNMPDGKGKGCELLAR
jgi:hypothetical protein